MKPHKPLDVAPHALNMREVYLDALRELTTPYPAIQLPDWPMFNDIVGGFREKEFSILCGSTGAGKTTFLANISAQLLKQGVKHFVMSVETGHTDFMKRVISVLSGADLNTGEAVDPDLLKRVHRANERYLESDTIEFSIYEDRIPVEQLKADILWMVEKRGCKVVMIDNLNFFMEVTRAADAIIEMDRVVHELVIFCKQVPVHIVMVMHPRKTDHTSRNGTRILDENMIRGSALANQEAHNIFLWNRPDADMVKSGERSSFNRELTISKMRRRGVHTGKTLVFDSMGTRYIENRVV
jgi:twinkle protein